MNNSKILLFGPILIQKGLYYNDHLLILLGLILIIWDGIKVFYQIYYKKINNF
jgi:hypothetical protein